VSSSVAKGAQPRNGEGTLARRGGPPAYGERQETWGIELVKDSGVSTRPHWKAMPRALA